MYEKHVEALEALDSQIRRQSQPRVGFYGSLPDDVKPSLEALRAAIELMRAAESQMGMGGVAQFRGDKAVRIRACWLALRPHVEIRVGHHPHNRKRTGIFRSTNIRARRGYGYEQRTNGECAMTSEQKQYQAICRRPIPTYELQSGESSGWGDWIHVGYFASQEAAQDALSVARANRWQTRVIEAE